MALASGAAWLMMRAGLAKNALELKRKRTALPVVRQARPLHLQLAHVATSPCGGEAARPSPPLRAARAAARRRRRAERAAESCPAAATRSSARRPRAAARPRCRRA